MTSRTMTDKMHRHLVDLNNGYGHRMAAALTVALVALAENQSEVSSPVPGCIPKDDDAPTKDAIRTYVLALFVELGEFLQELDWKPWKTKGAISAGKVADEFADILAFLGVVLVQLEHLGISEDMLANAYREKSIVNVERFLGVHGEHYVQPSLLGEAAE